MTYNEFKDAIVNNIMDYLPEEFQKLTPKINTVQKVNRILDGLSLMSEGDETGMSPTVYLNMSYNDYVQEAPLQAILREIAGIYIQHYAYGKAMVKELDFKNSKDKIVFRLINTEKNTEFLENHPHRSFLDLSVVYCFVFEIEGGANSCYISNDMANYIGMNEAELYEAALKNTATIEPPSIETIVELFMRVTNMSESEMVQMIGLPRDFPFFAITNTHMYYGASSILYPHILKGIAERMGSDLYIFPSSVHEFLTVQVKDGDEEVDVEMMKEFVRCINETSVAPEEVLSDQVYYYNKETGELSIAEK